MLSREHRLLFLHTSRTGGTTIRELLRMALPDTEERVGQHRSALEARDELGVFFDESFRFAFVRNPWGRLWSWFAMSRNLIQNEERDFDAFLRDWVPDEGELILPNQCEALSDQDGRLLVHEVGRFERYEDEVRRIFKVAGVSLGEELQQLNAGGYVGGYAQYYSVEGRERVAAAYRADREFFDYEFEEV